MTAPDTNEPVQDEGLASPPAVITAPVQDAPAQQGSTAMMRQDDGEDEGGSIAAFASRSNFAAAQRMATALAASTIVPSNYRNSVANCLVALELASRVQASVMMVMQNLHIIDGKPSWAAAFLIASVNSCGRFSPLRYEVQGTEKQDGWRCRAFARELASGDVLEGEWITWEMAKAEGWVDKARSKWKTMPGQMMRYRAASFWTRTYAPEISLGMHTADEVEDFAPRTSISQSPRTADLNAALAEVVEISPAPAAAPAAAPQKRTGRPNVQVGNPCEACGALGTHLEACPYA